jgi:hypothetical protein
MKWQRELGRRKTGEKQNEPMFNLSFECKHWLDVTGVQLPILSL